MTDREKQLRRRDRLRIGAILALCLIGAVPVMVAMAASPDPSGTSPAATATDVPATTTAPLAPNTLKPPDLQHLGAGLRERLADRGFGGGHGAITITAIDGSKLSLTTGDGWTRTITVGADTTVSKGGQTIAVGALKVGDQIRFSQKRNDDGTYTITSIVVPTPKTGGKVTAVSGDTLTLKLRNGDPQTVTLDGSTRYRVGNADGSKADVKVGSRVTIEGSSSGTTFTALTVHIQPTVVAGQVTAKGTNSLTLKRRDGSTVVIHVSSDTKFGIRGKKDAGLADIAVGDTAWAAGTSRSDGSLDATGIAKGFGRDKGVRGDKGAKPNGSSAPSAAPG